MRGGMCLGELEGSPAPPPPPSINATYLDQGTLDTAATDDIYIMCFGPSQIMRPAG